MTEPRGTFVRLNDGPDSGNYPIDLLVTNGFNGWECYATVFFTGYPVMVVMYDEGTDDQTLQFQWSTIETPAINETEWEQILANFLCHIGEANEVFTDNALEHGLQAAYDMDEGIGDGHEYTAFAGEVAQKMRELQPELVPEPKGW